LPEKIYNIAGSERVRDRHRAAGSTIKTIDGSKEEEIRHSALVVVKNLLQDQSFGFNSKMLAQTAFLAPLLFLTSAINATILPRQVPAPAKGLKTIYSPDGVQIRYKNPGICETTPGVNTYSGYIDLDPKTHMYFWFIEARSKPEEAPTTLWLTGGPGSDSLIAAFIGKYTQVSEHHTTRQHLY
jgi:hypothetical protein